MYLLTDGQPAQVRLRFDGLTGTQQLAPTTPARLTVQGAAPGVETVNGNTFLYTAGDDLAVPGTTGHFNVALIRHDIHTTSTYTACFHTEKPEGPNPYAPGCPSTGGGQQFITPIFQPDGRVSDDQVRVYTGSIVRPAGHYGSGGSFTSSTPAKAAEYAQIWLDFGSGLLQARTIDNACPSGGVPEDGFLDVPPENPHERAVDCIVWWEIARGTGTLRYDPANNVTRGQMATFIANLITNSGGTLPSGARDRFSDDNGSPHENNINRLAEAGIVAGRSDGGYGPNLPVSRGQMAKFLVGAYEYRTGQPLTADRDYFDDDNGTTHEASTNKAAASGFTGGTGGTSYQPAAPVKRDQMASFIARVLDLLVTDGQARTPDNR